MEWFLEKLFKNLKLNGVEKYRAHVVFFKLEVGFAIVIRYLFLSRNSSAKKKLILFKLGERNHVWYKLSQFC